MSRKKSWWKKNKDACIEKINEQACKQKLVLEECPGSDYCLSLHIDGEHKIPAVPKCTKERGKRACGKVAGTPRCPGFFAEICISKANDGLYWGVACYEPPPKGKFPRRARTRKTKRAGRRPRPRP